MADTTKAATTDIWSNDLAYPLLHARGLVNMVEAVLEATGLDDLDSLQVRDVLCTVSILSDLLEDAIKDMDRAERQQMAIAEQLCSILGDRQQFITKDLGEIVAAVADKCSRMEAALLTREKASSHVRRLPWARETEDEPVPA